MQKILATSLLSLSLLCVALKGDKDATWTLDKNHARLGFSVTHLMVSDIEGTFRNFDAKISTTKEDFSDAVAEMSAEVKSIDTQNEKRDNDLRSPNFFDAAKYPTLTFKSKTFIKTNAELYQVTGDLTMHGVTKMISLTATCRTGTNPTNKKEIAGFRVTGKIKRSDFNISPNTPNGVVGDDIFIFANVEFSKNAPAESQTSK